MRPLSSALTSSSRASGVRGGARRVVPLRAQLDRVDLAAVQVEEGERHGVGREELEIGLLGGGRPAAGAQLGPQRLKCRVVVVRGIQPVELHVPQRRDQVIEPCAIRPDGRELPVLEDRRDGLGENDPLAPNRELLRVAQLVNTGAERFRARIVQRLGLLCDRLRKPRAAENRHCGPCVLVHACIRERVPQRTTARSIAEFPVALPATTRLQLATSRRGTAFARWPARCSTSWASHRT